MANNIDLVTIFNTVLDQSMEQGAVTGWMEANAGQIEYQGGGTVKVPKISTDGFGSMERNGEYPTGDVSLTNETYSLTQDRAVKLGVDVLDIEESKGVANGSNVLAHFSRKNAVPEIDAYRHMKLFEYANDALHTESYTLDADTVYSTLIDNINEVQGVIGEDYPLVIHMSMKAAAALQKSSEMTRQFILTDGEMTYTANSGQAITAKIKMLDGIPIYRVVNNRMYSNITLNEGETTYGYSTNDYSMEINWIIMAQEAPIAVRKYEDIKIIPNSINATSRKDQIIPNIYHDLWVFDNKVNGLFVSYKAIDAPELDGTLAEGSETGKTKFTAEDVGSGNTLGYKVADAELSSVPKLNQILTSDDYTAYTSGADITASADDFLYIYEIDSNKRVVNLYSKELEAGDIAS